MAEVILPGDHVFKESKDHSKYAVSLTPEGWVCVGGINREVSTQVECNHRQPLWEAGVPFLREIVDFRKNRVSKSAGLGGGDPVRGRKKIPHPPKIKSELVFSLPNSSRRRKQMRFRMRSRRMRDARLDRRHFRLSTMWRTFNFEPL